MKALITWFLNLLYPPQCMFCHKLLQDGQTAICGHCNEDLPEYDGPLRELAYFSKVVAPFYYEGVVRDAILRFKFRGMQDFSDQFARWMAIWVLDQLAGKYDMISWVPCSALRRWKRGFDQAERLARSLAKELGAEAVPTLKKVRHNQKQSLTMDAAARRANVLGVYEVLDPAIVAGKRILLVDDVLTTGATLSECGKMLQMAGSGDLVCAVIAVTKVETKE